MLLQNKNFFWKEIEKPTLRSLISLLKKEYFGKIHGNFTNRNDLRKANNKKKVFGQKRKLFKVYLKVLITKKNLFL